MLWTQRQVRDGCFSHHVVPEAHGLLSTMSHVIYHCGKRLPSMWRADMARSGIGCDKPVSPTTTLLSDTSGPLPPLHLLLEANGATSHCSWFQRGVATGEIDEEGQFWDSGPLLSPIPLHLNKGCVPDKCQRVCSTFPGHPAAEGAHGYVQVEVTHSQVPTVQRGCKVGPGPQWRRRTHGTRAEDSVARQSGMETVSAHSRLPHKSA